MFHDTFQSGFLSIFFSIGSNPLQIWGTHIQNGAINRISDEDIQSSVVEIIGSNVASTYVTCPASPEKALGIKLPYLVFVLKNLKKYFSFEIQVLDDKQVKRRFRASNFQSTTRVKPFICTMPMRLDEGWNQVQLSLAEFVRKAYGTMYVETLRVQIHANCRLRRVFFSERLYPEAELPPEFKLYSPVQQPSSTAKSTVVTQTAVNTSLPSSVSSFSSALSSQSPARYQAGSASMGHQSSNSLFGSSALEASSAKEVGGRFKQKNVVIEED